MSTTLRRGVRLAAATAAAALAIAIGAHGSPAVSQRADILGIPTPDRVCLGWTDNATNQPHQDCVDYGGLIPKV